MFGLIRDLLAEVVALAEHFAADVNDVFGVGIILGEDQGLWNQRAVREKFGKDDVPVSAQDRANLIGDNDGAVKVLRRVVEIVREHFLAGFA